MNSKKKIKIFWRIYSRINNRFCKGKLKINKIILFKMGKFYDFPKENKGWYLSDKKIIAISEDETLELQIRILLHELVHACQYRFYDEYYKKKKEKIVKTEKNYDKIMHDERGKNIYTLFFRGLKFCIECGKRARIFMVTADEWDLVVPKGTQLTHLCLSCYNNYRVKKGLKKLRYKDGQFSDHIVSFIDKKKIKDSNVKRRMHENFEMYLGELT